jgi:general secretion pathway protein G
MKKNKNRRFGFTLVELLLVIAILGVLGTVVVVKFGGVGEEAAKTSTLQSISAIDTAIEAYKARTHKSIPPKSLEVLAEPLRDGDDPLLDAGKLKDAWGNPFDYSVDGKKYTIRSAGPDEQMNTEDDLTN